MAADDVTVVWSGRMPLLPSEYPAQRSPLSDIAQVYGDPPLRHQPARYAAGDLKICGCGCGERCYSLRGRFLRGHATRHRHNAPMAATL